MPPELTGQCPRSQGQHTCTTIAALPEPLLHQRPATAFGPGQPSQRTPLSAWPRAWVGDGTLPGPCSQTTEDTVLPGYHTPGTAQGAQGNSPPICQGTNPMYLSCSSSLRCRLGQDSLPETGTCLISTEEPEQQSENES